MTLTGSRLGPRRTAVYPRDHIAGAAAQVAGRWRPSSVHDQVAQLTGNASSAGGGNEHAQFVAPLVFRVHRQKAQHEQIHGSRDNSQTDKDEEDAEDDVGGTGLEDSIRLQRHQVAETNRRQRDDAVVDRVEVSPAFTPRERPRAAGDHQRREAERDDDEVRWTDEGLVGAAPLLTQTATNNSNDASEQESRDDVQPLADWLEHHQIERNSSQSVEHAKHFAAWRLRCAVTVPWNTFSISQQQLPYCQVFFATSLLYSNSIFLYVRTCVLCMRLKVT